jgi:hypothetical protein
MAEVFDTAKATVQARRETVDYVRATLEILQQILAKLDKGENAVRAQ